MAAMPDPRHAAPSPAPEAVDVGLSDLHALLEDAGWSADALVTYLPAVLAEAGTLHAQDRCAWLGAVRAAFAAGRICGSQLRGVALALATRWCDWPLACALGTDLAQAEGEASMSADQAQAWIHALHLDGRHDEAIVHCRRRMLAHPRESWSVERHATLRAWQTFVDARCPAIQGQGLRLEPLGHQHLADFAWQFHDPEIAALCCLPGFASDREWHAWLDRCWGYGDQRLYAVLHPEWGFVGSVSLIQHGDVGFFYYWLGPDFQGHGLGPAAVRLLLAHAREAYALRNCHAKVFERNLRSRRGLEKLGFRALQVRGIPPFDGEVFYRLRLDDDAADGARAAPVDEARDIEELRWLLERMDAETRLAAPMLAGSRYGPSRRRSA